MGNIYICYLDLSLIPLASFSIEEFVEGALKLEVLRLVDTDVPKDLVEEILRSVTSKTKLELLEISVEDACNVSELVLQESHLKELRISDDYKYDEESYMIF